MITCPFRTDGCGLSVPCRKCRAATARKAHTFVRYSPNGGKR